MNASFEKAVTIATMNEAWIERVWWETSNNDVVVYFIEMPWIASILFTPLCLLACWNWRFWFALAPFISLWVLRRCMELMLPKLFAYAPYFLVCSRGIIILTSNREPLFLPWASIVDYSWSAHVASMTSQMTIQYATANNQVATVVLDGEEKKQSLGELVDILQARIGS